MVVLLGLALPVAASAPIENFEPKAYLAQYTSDPKAFKVVSCESGWKVGPATDRGDHGLAHGRAQFHEETFYRLQKASGDDQMYKWGDERAELRILAWSLAHGHGREWTCYK